MSQSLTIQTVESEIISLGPQIAALLPPDVPLAKFQQVAMAAIRNNPDLLKCNQQSLFNACLNAAQDGLLPDGREGAIVPRKSKAVWQPMIQGIYKRVKTSGSVAGLTANVVYEGEDFEVLLGDDDRIIHRRDMNMVAKGSEVAVYAIATLKDGTKEREVMTWDQVQDVRKSSAMPDSGPWTQWADEMARKTVVRRLAKRLPVLDPADEALHRTINRVDSLYDFGNAPPERPVTTVEAPRQAAAAASTPRLPRKAGPVTNGNGHRAPSDPLDLPLGHEWLVALKRALDCTASAAEVTAIGGHASVNDALSRADTPPKVKQQITEMLADAYAKHAKIEADNAPENDPDGGPRIAGEAYVGAG
jgi:recombination protein RecT